MLEEVENLFDEVKTVSIQPLSLDQMVTVHHLRVAPANAVANIELAEASHGQRQAVDLLNDGDPFLKRLGHPTLQDILVG